MRLSDRGGPPVWAILLAVVLLTAATVFFSRLPSHAGDQLLSRSFYIAVFLVDLNLLFVALFLLGRSLVRLWLDRSRGLPGSRFKSKIVALLGGLVLVPTVLLFIVASGLIEDVMERWFAMPVEAMVDDAFRLQEAVAENRQAEVRETARKMARRLEKNGIQPVGRKPPAAWLAGELSLFGLASVQVFDDHLHVLAEQHSPALGDGALGPVEPILLDDIRSGKADAFSLQRFHGEQALVVGYAGIADRSGAIRGLVSCGYLLPPLPSALEAGLSDKYEAFKRSAALKDDIRRQFIVIFLLATILILFGSVWIGMSLAQRITVPVTKLAEGTHEIMKGNLDYRIEISAHDELGDLVGSFNRMAQELRRSHIKVQDSTIDLIRSSAELEERQSYIETLLAKIPAGVISLDREGKILDFNASALKMLRLKREECTGQRYREVFRGKEFLELRVLIDKVMGIKDIRLTRELKIPVGGQPLAVAVSFTALIDPKDDYIGMIIVLDDLSEFVKAQKIAAWREVARRIAHEIKNPLTPIQLSAQRIARRIGDNDPSSHEVIVECTEAIMQEVTSLKTLVDSFSRFARMPEVQPVRSNLNQIVNAALMPYETTHSHIVFDKDLQEGLPRIDLDPEQMKRALVNLIDNAVAAMDGKGTITIRTSFNHQMQLVLVEVADEGPGIAPEIQDKLFTPYFSTRKGGTGLGLAIVNRIVSDHRGYIKLEANEPTGARFVIQLPA